MSNLVTTYINHVIDVSLAVLHQVPAETWQNVSLWSLVVYVGLLSGRFVFVAIGRKLGLYSPDQYHLWPRLPWRSIYIGFQSLSKWHEQVFLLGRRGGTGGFASALENFCNLYKPGLLHLGRATAFGFGLLQPVGIKITRHVFILAMTGTGKTTALITMIALWRGSAFVIDPKAQIVNALRKRDKKRQWLVFDPDGTSNTESISINFLDCIKETMQHQGEGAAVLWAMRIAEALIVTPSGSKIPYFFDVSRQFTAGLILHILSRHPESDHHLPFMRDLIIHGYRMYDENGQEQTKDDDAHALLLKVMSENPAFGGVIAGAVSSLQSAGGETGGNVRSTLQEQTKFLDLPNVRAVLKSSDLSLRDLKRRDDIVLAFTASIYSIREELSRLSRLLTNMIAYSFEAEPNKKGQCLVTIDELPSQGYNPTIEILLAVARSMGITFVGVSQNIELMKKHYPDSWKSFIGEADCTLWMGANHPDNASLLTKLLGKKTIVDKDRDSGRKTYREIDVIEPEQGARYLDPNSDHLVVTRAGARAFKLRNDPYYKALPVRAYDPDLDHKEKFWRRLVRKNLHQ